ncbi:MAG: c-type cytochrome [Acidobacteriota bacterium]
MRRQSSVVLAVVSILLFAGLSASAEEPWSWPEKAQNLQVLPKDWPGARLRAPMTGFTRALGVRCSHCHVGEEGKPLSTYDFASDENPNKNRAREMLRMLGSVGDHLGKIEPSGEQRVNMWCHTCHRGRPRPMTLGEELSEIYRAEGMDAALEHHAELKKSYYGRGAYDFASERPFNQLGYAALEKEDTEGAIRAFTLNSERFPDSATVWDSLAEAHMKAGEVAAAERFYKKSLEIDPTNQNAKDVLQSIEKGERG